MSLKTDDHKTASENQLECAPNVFVKSEIETYHYYYYFFFFFFVLFFVNDSALLDIKYSIFKT